MSEHNLRFDRSPVTVKHHSARGEVLRNTDNFTRGSQLISHQFTMFFAGIIIPLLMWLGIFVVIYWIMLSAVMGENEVQLCAMKLYSAVWGWLEFSPYKQMNVPMPGHQIRPTSIGYIGYLSEVQTAWAKATHALAGSVAASSLIAMPLAARTDSEIDLSDIPELTEEDWKNAVRSKRYSPVKAQITASLDKDVLAWLKSDSRGYQTRTNAILRREMLQARASGASG